MTITRAPARPVSRRQNSFAFIGPKAAIVHGAAGLLEHYREAVRATSVMRQVVLIETDTTDIGEWTRFLGDGKRLPILQILPRDGVHPVLPSPERLQ